MWFRWSPKGPLRISIDHGMPDHIRVEVNFLLALGKVYTARCLCSDAICIWERVKPIDPMLLTDGQRSSGYELVESQ